MFVPVPYFHMLKGILFARTRPGNPITYSISSGEMWIMDAQWMEEDEAFKIEIYSGRDRT